MAIRGKKQVHPLVAARRAKGLTATDLASRTGITLRTIERIENGYIRRPHRLTREAIATELDFDPAEVWPLEEAA